MDLISLAPLLFLQSLSVLVLVLVLVFIARSHAVRHGVSCPNFGGVRSQINS